MSLENVEIVRRLYERVLAQGRVFDRATRELLPQFFDPEIHLHQMSEIVGTRGEFHGYQGLVDSTRELFEAWSDLGFVAEEIRAAGDKVAVIARAPAIGRASGAAVEWRGGHLWTLRDGRIVRWEVFDDPAQALQAVEER
jgi:ketosteroid isomerase-like protein